MTTPAEIRAAWAISLQSKNPTELLDKLQRTVAQASGKPSWDREDEDEMIKILRVEILSRMKEDVWRS